MEQTTPKRIDILRMDDKEVYDWYDKAVGTPKIKPSGLQKFRVGIMTGKLRKYFSPHGLRWVQQSLLS